MKPIVDEICNCLARNQAVVQTTIISDVGSTPRTAGSKMLVYTDGRIAGTIGGGLVEAKVIESALALHRQGGVFVQTYDLAGNGTAESMDVICGGRLSVLLERIDPTDAAKDTFVRLQSALSDGRRGFITARLTNPKAGQPGPLQRSLFFGDNIDDAPPPAPDLAAHLKSNTMDNLRVPVMAQLNDRVYLIEPVLRTGTVLVFGAGHVSRDVAELAKKVDFRTVVVDDRAEFANQERFPDADDVRVIENFSNAMADIVVDADSYIIIVTRGHSHDRTVLAQALRTRAAYIGMIGSRRKREAVYAALRAEGFSDSDLKRVHCPIGLEIEAETPAEIAVSIIAELIRKRAAS